MYRLYCAASIAKLHFWTSTLVLVLCLSSIELIMMLKSSDSVEIWTDKRLVEEDGETIRAAQNLLNPPHQISTNLSHLHLRLEACNISGHFPRAFTQHEIFYLCCIAVGAGGVDFVVCGLLVQNLSFTLCSTHFSGNFNF